MDRSRRAADPVTDRERLRHTFDSAADLYHSARPRYPAELFDTIADFVGRPARAQSQVEVLEIGPATGVATQQMAERDWSITAVELGAGLATAATGNLAAFPNASIVQASFDDWTPSRWHAYGLVCAATSWHWLDPTTRCERAHRHLRPGGTLAFWSALHVVPEAGDTFFADIQGVYDEIGESHPGSDVFPQPGELPTHIDELAASGLFTDLAVHHFDWEIVYDADSYLDLLNTFSGHIALSEDKRTRLYDEIRQRLAERPSGTLRRHWGAALHLARSR